MGLKPVLLRTAVACCLFLCGCGGSGGAPGIGSVLGNPSLSLSTAAIREQASITESAGPSATIQLSSRYAPSGAYIGYAYSTNGVVSVAGNAPGPAPSALVVTFQAPYKLKPGTYTDSLQIELCADSECQQPLTQRQFVTLTYVVTAAPAGQSPRVMLSANSVSLQQFLTSMPTGSPQAPAVTVSFANVPAAPFVTTTSTGIGVGAVQYSAGATATSGGTLNVYLKPPQQVGAGTYQDTVTLSACLDLNCNNPLTPVTLGVTYTVTNTVAGANGYTINTWQYPTADLAWDAVHGLLLIALMPLGQSTDGRLSILDPVSGSLSSTLAFTGAPSVLAVAADGTYLYVGSSSAGTIQRYTLPSLTPDIAIVLPNYDGTATYARTIEVAPDDAHAIAVTMQDGSGNPMGLVVFDDATARAKTFGYVGASPAKTIDSAVWGATGATLYGTSGGASGQSTELYAFAVDASGVTLSTDQTGGPAGHEHFAQNLLYLDGGAIVDPASLSSTGSFAAPKTNLLMTPDVAGNRAFFLNTATASGSFSGQQLESYDLSSQASIATVPMPFGNSTATRLIRWGSAGLAFADIQNGVIVTVNGAFVGP
jgi:hypothetical protein